MAEDGAWRDRWRMACKTDHEDDDESSCSEDWSTHASESDVKVVDSELNVQVVDSYGGNGYGRHWDSSEDQRSSSSNQSADDSVVDVKVGDSQGGDSYGRHWYSTENESSSSEDLSVDENESDVKVVDSYSDEWTPFESISEAESCSDGTDQPCNSTGSVWGASGAENKLKGRMTIGRGFKDRYSTMSEDERSDRQEAERKIVTKKIL